MDSEIAAWGGLAAGLAAFITSAVSVVRSLFGRGKAEGRLMAEIENIAKDVQTALDRGQTAITRADIVNAQLLQHRLEIAEKFGQITALTGSLDRTTDAVQTLSERLDRVLEANGGRRQR